MPLDPRERAAMQHALTLSADIEVQLTQVAGGAPLVALLRKATRASAAGLLELATVAPNDAMKIATLQTDIRAYDRIIEWMRELVADGFDAEDALEMFERDDLVDAIGLSEGDAQDALDRGLPPDQP